MLDRLTVRDLRVLLLIEGRPGVRLKGIYTALELPPSTAHNILTKLLALGLVRREGNGYFLTGAGRNVIKSAIIAICSGSDDVDVGALLSQRSLVRKVFFFIKKRGGNGRCVEYSRIADHFRREGYGEDEVREALDWLFRTGQIFMVTKDCYRVVP